MAYNDQYQQGTPAGATPRASGRVRGAAPAPMRSPAGSTTMARGRVGGPPSANTTNMDRMDALSYRAPTPVRPVSSVRPAGRPYGSNASPASIANAVRDLTGLGPSTGEVDGYTVLTAAGKQRQEMIPNMAQQMMENQSYMDITDVKGQQAMDERRLVGDQAMDERRLIGDQQLANTGLAGKYDLAEQEMVGERTINSGLGPENAAFMTPPGSTYRDQLEQGPSYYSQGTARVPAPPAAAPNPMARGTDKVPAMLTKNEAVLNPGAAAELGRDKIAALNRRHAKRPTSMRDGLLYAAGGTANVGSGRMGDPDDDFRAAPPPAPLQPVPAPAPLQPVPALGRQGASASRPPPALPSPEQAAPAARAANPDTDVSNAPRTGVIPGYQASPDAPSYLNGLSAPARTSMRQAVEAPAQDGQNPFMRYQGFREGMANLPDIGKRSDYGSAMEWNLARLGRQQAQRELRQMYAPVVQAQLASQGRIDELRALEAIKQGQPNYDAEQELKGLQTQLKIDDVEREPDRVKREIIDKRIGRTALLLQDEFGVDEKQAESAARAFEAHPDIDLTQPLDGKQREQFGKALLAPAIFSRHDADGNVPFTEKLPFVHNLFRDPTERGSVGYREMIDYDPSGIKDVSAGNRFADAIGWGVGFGNYGGGKYVPGLGYIDEEVLSPKLRSFADSLARSNRRQRSLSDAVTR